MNTNYFTDLVAGNVFGSKKTPPIPIFFYIGVSKTEPNVSGLNVTEPTIGGYSRVRITNLSAPKNGVVTNNSPINFPESTAAWGTATHYVIFDSPKNGNLLMYGLLTNPTSIKPEEVLTFKEHELQLVVQNPK